MQLPGKGKTLTLSNVDSDKMGSGNYQIALTTIEARARKEGFEVFVIEGVDDPRHWKFYEEKMGYKQTVKSHPPQRTYYKLLNP